MHSVSLPSTFWWQTRLGMFNGPFSDKLLAPGLFGSPAKRLITALNVAIGKSTISGRMHSRYGSYERNSVMFVSWSCKSGA
ncbi:hypothetical protein SCLCIDRAFT_958353 [Scleroderma citrinum Foug A]|uniref:Uncharacterized protein n=1 Tax=Scleroderma citrinum Foug A TaxID=1036808 RepID=A0A0C3EKR6_9AGAM|nr:hypothetical protein SCLCIDRAFT_958353 [Scleroderma citrinum Foug A]